MFKSKLDVQGELDKLAEEEQTLRNKYGEKFSAFYGNVVNKISCNEMIINKAKASNVLLGGELTEVVSALDLIQYEV